MVHLRLQPSLPKEELKAIPTVCGSLREALGNLDKDRAFLKNGGVFDDDFINAYIDLKMSGAFRNDAAPGRIRDVLFAVTARAVIASASEAIQCRNKSWIASSLPLLAMTAMHLRFRRSYDCKEKKRFETPFLLAIQTPCKHRHQLAGHAAIAGTSHQLLRWPPRPRHSPCI